MQTVKIAERVNLAALSVSSRIAPADAAPGEFRDVRIVEIVDIPDDVPLERVLAAWRRTIDASYLGRGDQDYTYPRNRYRFDEIGDGRIIR